MDQPRRSILPNLVRILHPMNLILVIILYTMGAGIHKYLGSTIDFITFVLGLACVILLQCTSYLLTTYYNRFDPRYNDDFEGENPEMSRWWRSVLLQISITFMTVGSVLTVLLFIRGAINLETLFVLGSAFLVAFFYAVPPIRLASTGYQELVETFLIAYLVPALGFLFQAGNLHRLVTMLTFPLTALTLAMLIATSLPNYGRDLIHLKSNLAIRMGWQNAMSLHNILILVAYLVIGIDSVLGMPWHLAWPGLLTLPIGLFQIYLMYQIMSGVKPRWRILRLTAVSLPLVMAYLFVIAIWTG